MAIVLYTTKNRLSFDKNLIRAIQSYENLRKGKTITGAEANIVMKRLKMDK